MKVLSHSAAVPLHQVKIADPFWSDRVKLIAEKVIPYQWQALNDELPYAPPSHAVENFRIAAGLSAEKYAGFLFQDSDLAKWIEAAAYSLVNHPNPGLESIIDGLIDLIDKAQQEDGYLNTYYTVAKPGERWTDFSQGHELYCAGHMIEAAIAYYEATEKRKLLDMVCRYADYIDSVMGPEEQKRKVYCGHEEIELALMKLHQATGENRYLELSRYFLEERGKQPRFLPEEKTFAMGVNDPWFQSDYHQAHAPVLEQKTAEGHAVRAMYLYCAMTDLAIRNGDESLKATLRDLWNNVVNRRMYITGGIGSQGHGERFTIDYDLPNDVAYAETCASIGLIFWAHRMLRLEKKAQYADVLERALFNGVLSGMSLDGTQYFYVNPLEVFPETVRARHDHTHVKPERQSWFGCACCPPNIARLLSSLGQYLFTQDKEGLSVHLYVGSETSLEIGGRKVGLSIKSGLPWNGNVSIVVSPESLAEFAISLRIPEWSGGWQIAVNGAVEDKLTEAGDGYVTISREWKPGDLIQIDFAMPVLKIRANPNVRENIGKISLQRGPLVYCMEEIDNEANLAGLRIPEHADWTAVFDPELMGGMTKLRGNANRFRESSWNGKLYSTVEPVVDDVTALAIPYSYWGNRSKGEMAVWFREC